MVEHGLHEEEFSLGLQQVVQNDVRLFQKPVRNDLVQVASQRLVQPLCALAGQVRARHVVKLKHLVENRQLSILKREKMYNKT